MVNEEGIAILTDHWLFQLNTITSNLKVTIHSILGPTKKQLKLVQFSLWCDAGCHSSSFLCSRKCVLCSYWREEVSLYENYLLVFFSFWFATDSSNKEVVSQLCQFQGKNIPILNIGVFLGLLQITIYEVLRETTY